MEIWTIAMIVKLKVESMPSLGDYEIIILIHLQNVLQLWSLDHEISTANVRTCVLKKNFKTIESTVPNFHFNNNDQVKKRQLLARLRNNNCFPTRHLTCKYSIRWIWKKLNKKDTSQSHICRILTRCSCLGDVEDVEESSTRGRQQN